MTHDIDLAARETHSGAVIVFGDRAYKLKKPVNLGFLDFRERRDRLRACQREVELNRRLAPDVYLGVADVHDPDGQPCEHLVVMRRMPDERRLAALVEAGEPVEQAVYDVARMIAKFHSTAARSEEIAAQGSRDAVRARWQEHFEDLRPFRGEVVTDDLVDEIERRAEDFLAGRDELFRKRIAEGRIVDGHGDLLADDIFCLDDGPRVLDCLDFSDMLRWLDGLDDLACLAMDLEYRGGAGLAERVLESYTEAAADPAPASLRHHYVAYRALMRAKVDCLRHAQGEPAATNAQHHAELARAHLRSGSVRLVLVAGLPGTGKSTVAAGLAQHMGARLLSSDRLRKELAGLDPTVAAPAEPDEGIYSAKHTDRTYQVLADRAGQLLAGGETVVLDASWVSAGHRERAAAVATRTSSTLHALWCQAPPELAAERIRARVGDVSDADPVIAELMSGRADPWPQAETVDTAGSPERSVAQAVELVAPV